MGMGWCLKGVFSGALSGTERKQGSTFCLLRYRARLAPGRVGLRVSTGRAPDRVSTYPDVN